MSQGILAWLHSSGGVYGVRRYSCGFCAIPFFVAQEHEHLVELFGAHFPGNSVVLGIAPEEARGIIVELGLREIGHVIFSFCENAMACGAMGFVKHLSFFKEAYYL